MFLHRGLFLKLSQFCQNFILLLPIIKLTSWAKFFFRSATNASSSVKKFGSFETMTSGNSRKPNGIFHSCSMNSAGEIRRRHRTESRRLVRLQPTKRAISMLFSNALFGVSMLHLLSSEPTKVFKMFAFGMPDCRMPFWKRPRDPGAIKCATMLEAPALSPKMVT